MHSWKQKKKWRKKKEKKNLSRFLKQENCYKIEHYSVTLSVNVLVLILCLWNLHKYFSDLVFLTSQR